MSYLGDNCINFFSFEEVNVIFDSKNDDILPQMKIINAVIPIPLH